MNRPSASWLVLVSLFAASCGGGGGGGSAPTRTLYVGTYQENGAEASPMKLEIATDASGKASGTAFLMRNGDPAAGTATGTESGGRLDLSLSLASGAIVASFAGDRAGSALSGALTGAIGAAVSLERASETPPELLGAWSFSWTAGPGGGQTFQATIDAPAGAMRIVPTGGALPGGDASRSLPAPIYVIGDTAVFSIRTGLNVDTFLIDGAVTTFVSGGSLNPQRIRGTFTMRRA